MDAPARSRFLNRKFLAPRQRHFHMAHPYIFSKTTLLHLLPLSVEKYTLQVLPCQVFFLKKNRGGFLKPTSMAEKKLQVQDKPDSVLQTIIYLGVMLP